MHVSWEDAQLFLTIAETGSLSSAARKLRVTQPTVSRRLADLEAALGEALFQRSVEGVALTTLGDRMLPAARQMAEHAAELERITSGADTRPRGVVRLTAPPGVAFDFVAPFAAFLRTKLPDVTLEVVSAIHYLDLSRREADLAIRMQLPTQRDLVCLASLRTPVRPYATRAYIDGLRRGYGVGDVAFVGWAPPLDHLPPNPQLRALVPGWRPVFASDDFLVQLRAAEAGVGAIFLGRANHRFALPTPLEEVDVDVGQVEQSIHLVGAKSALGIPRVRAVAELIAAEVEKASTRAKPRRSAAVTGRAVRRR